MGKIKFKIGGNISQTNQIGDNKIELCGEITQERGEDKSLKNNEYTHNGKTSILQKLIRFSNTSAGILLSIFLCSIAFFLFAVWLKNRYAFEISGDSIVLAFVGIAATFVVVSNYAQVKGVEGKFKKEVSKIGM